MSSNTSVRHNNSFSSSERDASPVTSGIGEAPQRSGATTLATHSQQRETKTSGGSSPVGHSLLLKAPADFIAPIFPYLDLSDLVHLFATCKRMHRFAEGDIGERTWRRYVASRGIRLPGLEDDSDDAEDLEDMDLTAEEIQAKKKKKAEQRVSDAARKAKSELATQLNWGRDIPDENTAFRLALERKQAQGAQGTQDQKQTTRAPGYWQKVARYRLVKHRIVVGNLHEEVTGSLVNRATNNHRWTCFVRSVKPHEEAPFLKEVDFGLHPTFHPPVVKTTKPPFQIVRVGWGVFNIGLVIHFNPEFGLFEPIKIDHYLSFSRPETSRTFELDFSGSELRVHEIVSARLPPPRQDHRTPQAWNMFPDDDDDEEEEEDDD